jgi:S-adenosylmethionine-diacylglycerol 3-amino-3-carboxypropyl transferase
VSKYFTKLNYSLGDEDSAVEYHLLPHGARRVAAVAGGGGRILPLLAKSPERLCCFDILKEQLHLTRLRVESARALELEEFAAFWGYPPAPMAPRERKDRFRSLPLPGDAAESLSALFERLGWTEIIYVGRFERMFKSLAWINHLFTGRAGRGLFDCETVEDQIDYLESSFPDLRWRVVLSLLANSTVLNSILYKGDFPQKNIPDSTYANFRRIYDRIFRGIRVKESFFAQLSFFGRLVTREAGLMEVDPEIFDSIKHATQYTQVDYIHGDIVREIANCQESYNFVSLSDVPSFLPTASEALYLRDMRPGLDAGAVVVTRGNLRVITPETLGYEDISGSLVDLGRREKTQLWHVNAFKRTADHEPYL